MKRSRSTFIGALLCALALSTAHAAAQAGCIPPAGGVPYLSGPPQWLDPSPPSGVTRPQVDDPRWAGAYRQDFPTQFGTEATFRALNSGGYLYFTLQSLIDPNGTTSGDTIWIGLGDGTNSHLLMFDLDSASGAGPSVIAGSYWSKSGGGAGGFTAGAPPAWVESSARWVGTSSTFYAWVVNLRVKAADAGLGSSFKLWYAITVNQNGVPLTTALYQWPIGGVSTTAPENVFDEGSVNPDVWGNASAPGAACTGGISLAWNQIGADPPPVNEISTVNDNQFFALPSYGAFSIVTGMIQARFRFANWGSTIMDKQNAPWIDIALPTVGAKNDAAGAIRFTCTHGAPTATTPACPAPSAGNPDHQCMLVELSKVPAPPGAVPNLWFSSDSATRNMDFTSASHFESKADIDIRGLPALGSATTRDVFLYVKARNMPAHGKDPITLDRKAMDETRRIAATPPVNDGQLPPYTHDDKPPVGKRGGLALRGGTRAPTSMAAAGAQPAAAVGAAQPAAASTNPPPPVDDKLAKSPYEHLASAWPAYEVHAFHDTGKILVLKGKKHILVEPMVPFGYFVDHQGALYGWDKQLQAQGDAKLEQLADNYYRVRVPNNGSVQVKTVIEAAEQPTAEEPPGKGKIEVHKSCSCGVLGAAGRENAGALLGVAGLALAIAVRLRRRNG